VVATILRPVSTGIVVFELIARLTSPNVLRKLERLIENFIGGDLQGT
jgi:hypothetical protein